MKPHDKETLSLLTKAGNTRDLMILAEKIMDSLIIGCKDLNLKNTTNAEYANYLCELSSQQYDITCQLHALVVDLKRVIVDMQISSKTEPQHAPSNTLDLIKQTVIDEAKNRHLAIDTIEIEWSEHNQNRVEAIKISGHRAADIWTRHSPLPSEVPTERPEFGPLPAGMSGRYPDGGIVDELNTDKGNEVDE